MINENYKVVPIGNYEDMSSDVTFNSINMKNYHKATLILQFVSIGTANPTLTVYSGATDAATTSALYFNYAWGGAAEGSASCDVLEDWTNANTLEIAHATYDNYMLVVEVDAASMDIANEEEWLTAVITDESSPHTVTGNVTAFAILEPRYKSNQSETALA